MTIREVIAKVNDLQPNTYSDATKIEWLSALDFYVVQEIWEKYEEEHATFTKYTEDTDLDTELLVPDYYATDLYIPYLLSKIDFANNEIGRFNNSSSLYNSGVDSYRNYYNNTHTHKQPSKVIR